MKMFDGATYRTDHEKKAHKFGCHLVATHDDLSDLTDLSNARQLQEPVSPANL